MKKILLTFILLSFLFIASAKAQEEGAYIGDASTDSGHIVHSREDSTGGLQKPGGIYFYGLNPNLTVRGFDFNINKKALDNNRGSDLTGPCAFLGNSFLSSSPTTCQNILVTAAAAGTCQTGYVLDQNGNCVFSCPSGQVPDGNGGCIVDCPTGQHESGGQCVCDTAGQVINSMGQCVVGCPGNQEDLDGDGTCECPAGYGATPDQNGICPVQCIDATKCNIVNNECVTICPAGQEDPDTNTCDPSNCADPNPCADGMHKNNFNVCVCNGDMIEQPSGSNNCECPPGSTWDTNSPPENPICICEPDKVWKPNNNNKQKCECSNANHVWSLDTGVSPAKVQCHAP